MTQGRPRNRVFWLWAQYVALSALSLTPIEEMGTDACVLLSVFNASQSRKTMQTFRAPLVQYSFKLEINCYILAANIGLT